MMKFISVMMIDDEKYHNGGNDKSDGAESEYIDVGSDDENNTVLMEMMAI